MCPLFQQRNALGKKTVNENVCMSDDEWLYMCEADAVEGLCVHRCQQRNAERRTTREPKTEWWGRKKQKAEDEDWRRKKIDLPVCVLLEGNLGDHLSPPPNPTAPPWPQSEASKGPLVPEEKHLGPHHPWTQRWGIYLGLAAWQLYWCYIQAHRDPESEREQEHKERGGGERDGWGMEKWGRRVMQGGSKHRHGIRWTE